MSKDVLEIGHIRRSPQILQLAKLLALEIGQLVNFNELAVNTGLNRETVVRFVDIFEQLSLVHRAAPISTNERESITKATKYISLIWGQETRWSTILTIIIYVQTGDRFWKTPFLWA